MPAEWYKEQPQNRNFLNPIGFLLKLDLFEGTDFFCQSANLPDISMPTIEFATRFRNLPMIPGGGVTFGDFNIRFIVDENLKNYYSIHEWIRHNGRSDDDLDTPLRDKYGNNEQYSNAQLHIVTSQYNPHFIVSFENIFPISLSGLEFNATIEDVEYLTAEVTFKHQKFFILDKNMKPL
jgi:hypothetical protein